MTDVIDDCVFVLPVLFTRPSRGGYEREPNLTLVNARKWRTSRRDKTMGILKPITRTKYRHARSEIIHAFTL